MPAAITQRELEALYDPLRYEQGPPQEVLAALRGQSAVVWVDEHELPLWPGGAGFWLVLRHADRVLMIAQHRMLEDNGTVAPTVSITNPVFGDTLIEGETIRFEAEAIDDVHVASVNLLINGGLFFADSAPPYQQSYTVLCYKACL